MKVWSKRTWVCVKTAVQAWWSCLSPETVYPLENLPTEAQPQGIWDQGQAVAKHWQKSTSQPIKDIYTPKQPKGVFWKTQSQKMTTKRTHSMQCKTMQGCSRWLLRCSDWLLVCCYEIARVHWAVEKTYVVVFMIFWSMIQVLPSKSVQFIFLTRQVKIVSLIA